MNKDRHITAYTRTGTSVENRAAKEAEFVGSVIFFAFMAVELSRAEPTRGSEAFLEVESRCQR
jgi:hypothetical protein